MSKRWLMVLSGLFAVSMFIGFNCVNVYAAEDGSEEISTEADESVHPSEGFSGEASSDAALESESSDDETSESESTSYSAEELESLIDKKKADKENAEARSEALNESESASSSSGGSTVIVQEQDDSAVRTLINEFIKGRDTLNGFQKQVLNRLDLISFCSVVILAVTICNFFFRK